MLSIEQLSKSYGDVKALTDVSFSLGKGEVVALLGANGSGKTTTINSICGLIEFEQGDIAINGESVKGRTSHLRDIGAVLGGCRNINWRMTSRQNAEYFARLRGASSKVFKPNIERLESRLGLDKYAKQAVRKLSTGNKQKASLMAALCYSPDLLLLDEPTLGLDVNTVNELQNIIEQQATENGQAFLITSHDMSFIDKICKRAIVIDQGKQLFDGSIQALKEKLHRYEMRFELASGDYEKLHNALPTLWSGKHQIEAREDSIVIRYDDPEQGLKTLSYLTEEKIHLSDLTITPLSIENAYLSLIEESNA